MQAYDRGRATWKWLLSVCGDAESHIPHNQLPKARGSGIFPKLLGKRRLHFAVPYVPRHMGLSGEQTLLITPL